jgi:hypothetical protein
MTDLDDRALRIVLFDDERDAETAELEAAVARVDRDVGRIRRGLELLAREAAQPTPQAGADRAGARRRSLFVAAVLTAAVAVAVGVAVVLRSGGSDERAASSPAHASVSPPPAGQPPRSRPRGSQNAKATAFSLSERVRLSDRIVIGTVASLSHGELGAAQGLPYVLATIDVERSLKPSVTAAGRVVAFDYDLAGGDSKVYSETSTPWQVGQRVLLFLASDRGTVSESLKPDHLQVVGGESGRYPFSGTHLAAPFSIAEIEAEVARQR